MHKYRVFFGYSEHMLTLKGLVPFMTPARIGEKVLFPQHMIALREMPDWIRHQGMWKIDDVVHQVEGVAAEKADMLILSPTDDPLTQNT